MNNKEKLKKVTDFLYKRSLNTSSRIKTYPKDNKNIVTPVEISILNTGKDYIKRELFVRVSFVGSDKYYQHHLSNEEEFKKWNRIIEDLLFEDDIVIDDDKDVLPW